jgi:histidyl-tRNA synthetase
MLDIAKPVAELREMGVNVFVDFSGRKLDKQFKTALKKQAPFALFIGADELESGQFTLKNLTTQKEEKHSLQRIVSIVKDSRLRER